MSLSGRVGLVTGGGTGIGLSIAKAFAAAGAKVYVTGRRLDVLEKAAASVAGMSGSIVPLQMDATDEESVNAVAKHVGGIDGKLDILVNNAGFAASRRDPDFFTKKLSANEPFEPETVQNWSDMFALNTITPFFVVRAFQSLLIKGAQSRPQGTSSVINISSVSANLRSSASGISLAYGPTKAALNHLTLVLATSFATRDIPIRVNAISPGPFASEIVPPEFLELLKTSVVPGLVAPVPAKRHGSEAEMGMTAVLLAVSDYTNGVILRIDGGMSLVNP
ncbi:related to dehydrogenases with different specificities (related to short-chain alcohol dehydrogenases) [Armillaria ostoyae]|uniref:Related to dehydrogenases with different specificities (Related to short-chain alcohol dehydrogenases) n=1 Tax=Armillaria ostoyae TaxID=47428 RepID=A0A284R3G7_ARMOS|nr:related to dehydrogenases with different specificities (related to short-chain alcohol dehydrogenases) [Armillaria ostoyae]